jgi:hypothetical protein
MPSPSWPVWAFSAPVLATNGARGVTGGRCSAAPQHYLSTCLPLTRRLLRGGSGYPSHTKRAGVAGLRWPWLPLPLPRKRGVGAGEDDSARRRAWRLPSFPSLLLCLAAELLWKTGVCIYLPLPSLPRWRFLCAGMSLPCIIPVAPSRPASVRLRDMTPHYSLPPVPVALPSAKHPRAACNVERFSKRGLCSCALLRIARALSLHWAYTGCTLDILSACCFRSCAAGADTMRCPATASALGSIHGLRDGWTGGAAWRLGTGKRDNGK